MTIKTILTSSLRGTSRIKTLLIFLVTLSLARSAGAQTNDQQPSFNDRQISFVDSPPNSALGVPGITTLKVFFTPLDKITIGEFEKNAPMGQLLQDLTQAWYDLAKQAGATDSQAGLAAYTKLEQKLVDMAAQTKSVLTARGISSKRADLYVSKRNP